MRFEIELNKENINKFINIFSSISLINNTITLIFLEKKIYILNMDESHIALINLVIKKTFFDKYDIKEDKLSITFSVNSFLKILNCFSNSQESLFLCYNDKEELIIKNSNKIFSLVLFSEHNDELEIPNMEYPVTLDLESSILKNYIKDLTIYNSNEFEINCENNKVCFCINSEEGRIKINLNEEEDMIVKFKNLNLEQNNFNLNYNLKYFEKFCKIPVDKKVKLSISSDFPMMFEYLYKDVRLRYYLSSLIREDN